MKRLGCVLLAFCASAVLAGEQFRVAVFNDRYVPPVRLETGDLPKGVEAVWGWTSDTAPQRIEAAAVPRMKPLSSRWLSVKVEPARGSEPLVLVAAPVAMWEEVPESLLPSYPVKKGMRIPVDGRSQWRLRVHGAKLGSWWTDVAPVASAATITATAAADRSLNVEDEEHRTVAAARLSIVDDGAERGDYRKLADYRSDDKGRLVVPAIPDGGAITLLLSSADRAPAILETRPSAIPRAMLLRRGNTVSGKLVDRFGLPVVNAGVTLRTWVSDSLPIPVIRQVVSGPDGTFHVKALPDGQGVLEASASAFADLQRGVKIAGDLDLGTIALQPAVVAEVVVRDERGQAVAGAVLHVGSKSAAVTDAKGHAALSTAAGEPVEIRVTAPHHRNKTATINVPPPKLTEIVLPRSFRVTGRFVDASGIGIAEARARCKTGARLDSAEVAADGHFDFDLEPSADYRIELFSPTTATSAFEVAKGAAGESRDVGDIVAPPSLTVHGRLVTEDRSPVPGARVWLPRPSEAGALMAWVFRDILETTTRANGEFELSGAPSVPFVLRIAAPELAPVRKTVMPEKDATRIDVGDIVLKRGTTVAVTLDDGSGDGAVAHADLGGAGMSIDMLEAPFAGGKALIRNVTSGPVTISVKRGHDLLCRQSLAVPADREEVEIRCATHKVRVTGVVKVGGRVTGLGTLVWVTPARVDMPTGVFTFGSGPMQQQRAFAPESQRETSNVGADGRFDGPELLPGSWEVLWMPDSGRMIGPRTMTIEDTTSAVTLDYPGVAITGVVLDAQRRPVKGADVRDVRGGGSALSREDGTFTLAGPEPGTWQVRAQYRGEASRVVPVVVDPDKQQPYIELVLGAEDTRIRVAAGAGATVFLESDGGRIDLASTDANGIASFRIVPPAPQRVRVASSSAGRWTFGEWMSFEEATKADVTLKTAATTGNVILRTKAASGPVVLTTADGWRVDRLLQWLGSFLRLAPQNEIAISGLPPGTYSVSVADQQRTLSVEKEKTVDFVFE